MGSKQTDPVITYLKNSGFIVSRDDMSIFIDKEGQPARKHPVRWTDIPIASGKSNCFRSAQNFNSIFQSYTEVQIHSKSS